MRKFNSHVRVEKITAGRLKAKDFCLFGAALVYVLLSAYSWAFAPLLGLFGYLLVARLYENDFSWQLLGLIVLAATAELLAGFAVFSCLIAALFLRYFVLSHLHHAASRAEILIAALIFGCYGLIWLLQWLANYYQESEFSADFWVLIYYAAAESLIAALFFKDEL